jgi:integrase
MASPLTATAVKNARPASARRELPDGACPGLNLCIEPSGTKRWTLRYRRPDGRSARLVLGSVHVANEELTTEPVIGGHHTLAGRRLVATLRHEIARGRDPGAAHLTGKQLRRAEIADTFDAAARDFIEQYAKKRTRRWQDQARVLGLRPDGIIRGGLVERWSNKSVADIHNNDIYIIVDECRHLGVPGLERRKDGRNESRAMVMLSTLSRMFGWLARNGKFWPAAAAERVEFSAPLKLLLLTGCRLNEVAGMRRSELSDDGATWHIPGARTKNKRPHIVPLPSLARDLIASVGGDGDLIFTTDGRSPVRIGSKIKQRLDQTMKISPSRLHDLRRTFVTGLAELGIRPDVIELAVNHVSGLRGGIAGVYNRSELLPERRAALERWATHVQGLVAARSVNVVSLRGRK